MKVYLAARYSRFEEMQEYADQLRALGHEVTARWILGDHDLRAHGESDADEWQGRWAQEDLDDLMAAEVMVFFGEEIVDAKPRRPAPNENERWVPVAGSTLGYEVSSFGRVRSIQGEAILGKKVGGYLRVKPSGKAGSSIGIHALVALTFLGPQPSPEHEVDHLDGFKDNNYFQNLEWVTHEENVRRAAARMRGGPHAGARNGRAKLTNDDVADIRARLRAGGESKAAIARDYEVTDVLIGRIGRGELWPVDHSRNRGGKNVEFGMAFAAGKLLIVVGWRENVFHFLPSVDFFPTWDEVLARFATLSAPAWRL